MPDLYHPKSVAIVFR